MASLDPPRPPFLGASTAPRPAAIVIGAPLDRTESFKSGTAEAPRRIREVSDVLETYSPLLDADLAELPFADWGDVRLDGLSMEQSLAAIADVVRAALDRALPILLGGEHTATLGAVRAAHERYPDLVVVQADAHTDLRSEYDGAALSHATVMRRIADELGIDRIVQCGIRSGTREEFQLARSCLSSAHDVALSPPILDRLRGAPIYFTIDIDVLDPASAPGTGCPEPGGASFLELIGLLRSLHGCHVVGCDVMEVLPSVDSNDIASVAAAKLVREMALAFGPTHREHLR